MQAEPNAGAVARSPLTRGLIAGFVAATALALWFLVVDGIRGQPFHTPAFLASLVLGTETVSLGLGQIAVYTVIHYAAFFLVGVVVAWLVDRLAVVPGLLLGAVLGFLLFDLLFYGSVWLTGVNVVSYLGWPEVLVGNVIAGVVLIGTVNLLGPRRRVTWSDLLARHTTIREGIVVGLIGAAAVAIWFLALDLIAGRILFTPAALGSILFQGARSAAEVSITAGTVLGYTVLHVGAFLLTGLIAAALIAAAEDRQPYILLGAILLFVTFETFVVGMLAIVAEWLLAVIPWWSIAVGNLVAAAAMGYYLWTRHPRLAAALGDPDLDREPAGPPTPRASGSS